MPLALALAGAMMQEHADHWERELVPLLQRSHKAALRNRLLGLAAPGDASSDDETSGEPDGESDGEGDARRGVSGFWLEDDLFFGEAGQQRERGRALRFMGDDPRVGRRATAGDPRDGRANHRLAVA